MGVSIGSGVAFGIGPPGSTGAGISNTPPAIISFLYSWGRNDYGQLGQGNTNNYSTPVQVGSLSTWSQIGCGYSTSAIKTDGTLWSCGNNQTFGALGNNSTTNQSSFVQIGVLSNWARLSVGGYNYVSAIKTDGSLWSWGRNYSGQLGQGNTTNYSSPVQVGALTSWVTVNCGYNHTGAIKSDGTLWTWGSNFFGQLGLNTTTLYSSPVQVGTVSNWAQVQCGNQYYTIALQSNGTLWAWGYNGYGVLGINTSTTSYSSPVQVGALSNWTQISTGEAHVAAIKTDGTLWTWGLNNNGQLGLNTSTSSYSSPVQVGSLSNWAQLSCGYYHIMAVQSNGTLWTWGNNSYGQLGLNTSQQNISSPVQVGVLSTWNYASAGTYDTFGLHS